MHWNPSVKPYSLGPRPIEPLIACRELLHRSWWLSLRPGCLGQSGWCLTELRPLTARLEFARVVIGSTVHDVALLLIWKYERTSSTHLHNSMYLPRVLRCLLLLVD